MHRTAIVLFARSPEREAIAKRMRFAVPLFRSVVEAWLREAQQHGATPVIACDANDREALASIAPDIEREWIEQRGATFGERVANAADQAFTNFDAVIIAAIDAPPRDLREALASLDRGIPVVSPSRDGGINFIGVLKPEPELLKQLEPRRRDLLNICRRYFERNAGVTPAEQAASSPRAGGGTPPAQPPRTAAFHIVGGTIDLDSESAFAIAKRDKTWRAFLPTSLTEELRYRGTEVPLRPAFVHQSRPPPAF